MPGLTSGASQPVTNEGAKRAIVPAPLRYNNYCEAQRAIAETNSRRDGKVYKAPCDMDAPAPPKPADKPKAPHQEPTTASGWRAYTREEPLAL